jgi:hypothetical protein
MLALLAIAGGVPAGCGNKTPIQPPGLVQPRPPMSLEARSTPSGVALTWGRPSTYTGGRRMNDLAGFEIWRTPVGGGPEETLRVGTLTLNDQERFRQERKLEWIDTAAVPDTDYSYIVIAFTFDGYRSAPAGPVEGRFSPFKAAPETPKKKASPGTPAQVDHSGSGQ